MIYLRLFWEFFKTGLFAIGGGMATLPFLYDLADSTGWYTYSQLADILAVSESTPGPVGINMATYVGYTVGGFAGAVTATVGIVLPGVILVLIIVSVLDKFRGNRYVDAAFYGLRPASTALIAAAGVSVVEISLLNVSLFKETGAFTDLIYIPRHNPRRRALGAHEPREAHEEAAPRRVHRGLGRSGHSVLLRRGLNHCRGEEQDVYKGKYSAQAPPGEMPGGAYFRPGDDRGGLKMHRETAPAYDGGADRKVHRRRREPTHRPHASAELEEAHYRRAARRDLQPRQP